MTDKQKRFITEYLIDGNKTQAAIRAGYPKKNARRQGSYNMTLPYIISEVNARSTVAISKTGLTQDWVLQRLQDVSDACMKPDMYGRIDSSGANKSAELIGKHLGMFTERSEITVRTIDDIICEDSGNGR